MLALFIKSHSVFRIFFQFNLLISHSFDHHRYTNVKTEKLLVWSTFLTNHIPVVFHFICISMTIGQWARSFLMADQVNLVDYCPMTDNVLIQTLDNCQCPLAAPVHTGVATPGK